MKKLPSNITNMSLSLLFITVVVAALLAWANAVTQGPIQQIKTKTESEGVKSVILGDSNVPYHLDGPIEKNGFEFYRVYSSVDSTLLGTAVKSVDSNAFGGKLVVLVGFKPDGVISGYQVLEHSETPGLGAQADTWFREKADVSVKKRSAIAQLLFGTAETPGNHNIIGMNPSTDKLSVRKDGGDVDAITASTITSRAFLRTVTNAYHELFGLSVAVDVVSSASVQK